MYFLKICRKQTIENDRNIKHAQNIRYDLIGNELLLFLRFWVLYGFKQT